MRKIVAITLTAAIVATAGAAMAATTNVAVTAAVVGTCQFNSNVAVGFGNLDQTVGTNATATGNVNFWCTKNSAYILGDETNPTVGDGTFSGTLVAGPESIPYTLAYTNVTGNGAGKTTSITSTITGTIANADYVNVAAGNYTDIVTFTIAP